MYSFAHSVMNNNLSKLTALPKCNEIWEIFYFRWHIMRRVCPNEEITRIGLARRDSNTGMCPLTILLHIQWCKPKNQSQYEKCVVDLLDPGWTVEAICTSICDTLGVSWKSLSKLYHWDAIYEEHGSVIWPPSKLHRMYLNHYQKVLTAIHLWTPKSLPWPAVRVSSCGAGVPGAD